MHITRQYYNKQFTESFFTFLLYLSILKTLCIPVMLHLIWLNSLLPAPLFCYSFKLFTMVCLRFSSSSLEREHHYHACTNYIQVSVFTAVLLRMMMTVVMMQRSRLNRERFLFKFYCCCYVLHNSNFNETLYAENGWCFFLVKSNHFCNCTSTKRTFYLKYSLCYHYSSFYRFFPFTVLISFCTCVFASIQN